MQTVVFANEGERLEGWWLEATDDSLTTAAGRPCVVMAHGFGCTRDCGLLPFAERFAAAGCEVLLFDYRGFGGSTGGSEGGPRQDVDHRRHRADYHAALTFARRRAAVDPLRVAVWGTSYSGGHVLAVAACDPRVAAVISQGAAVDGLAALTGRRVSRDPARPSGGGKGRTMAMAALDDLARAATRRPPRTVPLIGDAADPGSGAMFTGPAAEEFATILGPAFVNEMCARGLLRIGFNRPIRAAAHVRCPTLFVVAERDEIAPAASVREAAARVRGRVELAAYDCGHFAIYAGDVFEDSVERQVDFLRDVLRGG